MRRGASQRRGKFFTGNARHVRREAATLAAAAGVANCPRPDKRRYPNKREAKSAIRRSSMGRVELHAYRCPCGGFHVGHRRPRLELVAEPGRELGLGEAAA